MSVEGYLEPKAADPVIIPGADLSHIVFFSDASLVDQPNPVVRVALHSRSGGFSQIVLSQTVSSSQLASKIDFKAKDVDGVSLSRVDDPSTAAVSYLIY